MEFYHLRSFVVVAQTGNLTLAAKRLCTTPPAISAHIKALELELQTTLFIRSSKGMTLNDKGQQLLPQAQKTLDSAMDMVNLAADNQHQIIGQFILALNQSPSQFPLSRLFKNLQHNCPGISLQIEQMSSAKICHAIAQGDIDGGFIYGQDNENLMTIKVSTETITTIAPMGLELDGMNLAEQGWITMGKDCPFDLHRKKILGNDAPSIAKSSDDGSRLELVKAGLGLSFIEQSLALAHQHQIQVIDALDFSMDLCFVVDRARVSEPVIKTMMQEIRILWQIAL